MARYTKEQLQWARERVPETVPRKEWNRKATRLLKALPLLDEVRESGYTDMRLWRPNGSGSTQLQMYHTRTGSWVPTTVTRHSQAFRRLTHSLQRGELAQVTGTHIVCKHGVAHEVSIRRLGNPDHTETARVLPGNKCHACEDEAYPQRATYSPKGRLRNTATDYLYTFTHEGVAYFGRTVNPEKRLSSTVSEDGWRGYEEELGFSPNLEILLKATYKEVSEIEKLMKRRVYSAGGKRHDLIKKTEYVPEGLTVGRLLMLAIGDYQRGPYNQNGTPL